MNIVMTLEMAAECHPDRIGVTCGEQSLGYAALLQAARRAAGHIHASGCAHVGLLDVNSLAAPVALYGAAYAGVPFVPLNYRLTPAEIGALLARIAPAWLVADRQLLANVEVPAGVRVVARDEFLALAGQGEALDAQADPSSIAVQLFTSGTTGAPKAAVLRHENLMSYILGTVEFAAAGEDEATLVAVPPYHIAGISAVLSSTYAARRMVQLPNFDGQAWLELCRREGVTNAFVVPTMLARVIEYIDTTGAAAELPTLRALAYGGGKMPAQVIERAMQLWPHVDFTNAYGLTETSSTIALLDPDEHRTGFGAQDPLVRKRLHSVGKPI
ncbi:MAG TPA: AMP-binding protein, partial [Rubrivivax sp.]|nr:AMP-binding protein [Rubrivivax sp.]